MAMHQLPARLSDSTRPGLRGVHRAPSWSRVCALPVLELHECRGSIGGAKRAVPLRPERDPSTQGCRPAQRARSIARAAPRQPLVPCAAGPTGGKIRTMSPRPVFFALALTLAGCGSDPVDYYNLKVPEQ